MRKFYGLMIAVILACSFTGSALAAVVFVCSVTATGINFGLYNPLNAVATTAAGSWSVTCMANGTGVGVVSGTLSLSTGSSGTYSSRRMTSGVNTLNYNIYSTAAYSQIFGDGTGGTYAPTAFGIVLAGQQYQFNGTMYGRMPPIQDVAPGAYSDLIIVTVTY
ncbi:MAG: spore coat U domain-containing protein [Pseudomonadota bacterium]|nr:spore coat U domain-containing protein [Pseudomonadota bacterium]